MFTSPGGIRANDTQVFMFLIHPFRVTGSTNSLRGSVWIFLADFSQNPIAWLIRLVTEGVNTELIYSSQFLRQTNDDVLYLFEF